MTVPASPSQPAVDVSTTDALLQGLARGRVQVVDLTAPLHENTPMIRLPPERGQPWSFSRELISRYDEKGPHVYWNNLRMCEHTGTHFDAPIHWLTGRDLDDVSQVPVQRLVAPAVVIDLTAEATKPSFLLERRHVERWCEQHGPLPEGAWLLYRTGWSKHGHDVDAFLNDGVTPGVHPSCAQWLAERTAIQGIGVETVGTDAGEAGNFDPAYPCHWFFHGANKYGLTQLRNLHLLPPRGAILIVAPLPIVGGSGSPARVMAIFETEPAVTGRPTSDKRTSCARGVAQPEPTPGSEYASYMRTEELLGLQRHDADLLHRDERLFQCVHQSTELWLKQAAFEISHAIQLTSAARLTAAAGILSRAAACVGNITHQLELLGKMSSLDFGTLRPALGKGSGLESPGWREVRALAPRLHAAFTGQREAQGITLADLFKAGPDSSLYVLAEALLDVDAKVAVWRLQHLTVAVRTIGDGGVGTKGMPVQMLASLLSHRLFPDLWEARSATAVSSS